MPSPSCPLRILVVASAAALIAAGVAAAEPVRIESARFDGSWADPAGEAGPMRLVGAGLYRWGWFVRVYAAAYYVEASAPADLAADAPRRLEFVYLVGVSGRKLADVAAGALAGAYTPEELAPLRVRLDQLRAAFRDARPGDRYALTYAPGRGTELSLNGEPLAQVEGADVARACFGIWLGAHPVDPGLRRALLADPGGRREPAVAGAASARR
jgi:hypothetical protein